MDNAEDFYKTLFPRLYGIAIRRFSMSHEDAHDAVHDALTSYLEKEGKVEDVRKYVLGAFYYHCYTHLRKRLRVTLVPLDEAMLRAVQPPPHVEQLTVQALLRKLSPRDRRVLHLRFGLGYKVREIAADLGVSHGRAEKLLRAALKKVEAELEENPRRVGVCPSRTVTYVSLEYHPPTRCMVRRWTNSNRSRRSASRSTIRWHRANTSTSRTSFIRRASS